MNDRDRAHLRRCVDLAADALRLGHAPFGSRLVGADGAILFEDHNRIGDGDGTRHPELAIAQWAAARLDPAERKAATVYTSGEHCPMCAAAHGWVGLGRIVYASSSAQLADWLRAFGDISAAPVLRLPIHAVAPGLEVEGPDPMLADEIRDLHRRYRSSRG